MFLFLGIDFKQKLINLDGVPIKLQVFKQQIVIMTLCINLCCFLLPDLGYSWSRKVCILNLLCAQLDEL